MERLATIITAYDHHELTTAHVKHCMDVSRVPDEIIVVNDGGAENLREMLKELPKKCPVVYAYITPNIQWNYNGAFNLGIWLSSSNFLAFEDNDNIPSVDFYEHALTILRDNPKLARVEAGGRKVIALDDMLNKPREEWVQIGKRVANKGTAMTRKEVCVDLKGQDERFCGKYGYMYYDWRKRNIKRAGIENYSGKACYYFYTHDGQSDLTREMSSTNQRLFLNNAAAEGHQHPEGILNFNYTYEQFT